MQGEKTRRVRDHQNNDEGAWRVLGDVCYGVGYFSSCKESLVIHTQSSYQRQSDPEARAHPTYSFL